jgi:hypothetical protein
MPQSDIIVVERLAPKRKALEHSADAGTLEVFLARIDDE